MPPIGVYRRLASKAREADAIAPAVHEPPLEVRRVVSPDGRARRLSGPPLNRHAIETTG